MLNITNLTKKYGNKSALKDLTLQISPGELFCLIGPNGSGKTTLLKTILGLLRPTSGNVLVGSQDVLKFPEATKALMGYIPDEPTGWGNVTGEEFLHLVGALYGVKEEERNNKIPDLLKIFNLQEISDEFFESYSRGSRQKFAILAALLHKPKLLLIDEPIIGLDPASAITAKQVFTDYTQNGGTILMVTHTLSIAQEIASRIGFLKDGELKAVGTLAELESELGLSQTSTLEEVYIKLAS